VGDNDERRSLLDPLIEIGPEPFGGWNIERRERLIQEKDGRGVKQRPGESGPLEQPAAEPPGKSGAVLRQTGRFQRGFGLMLRLVEGVEPGGEDQVLSEGQIIVKQRLVGEQPDRAAALVGPPPQGSSPHLDGARRGPEQPAEQAEQSGFAGAVGTEHNQGFTGTERQVYSAKDADTTERALEGVGC
jgi:hypothetical protein